MDDRNYQARLRQFDLKTLGRARARMFGVGAHCLVKAVTLEDDMPDLCDRMGYFTMIEYISGRTPAEMRDILGLTPDDLGTGAAIYRLLGVPQTTHFRQRDLSYRVDGLPVAEKKALEMGYAPGTGAWQAQLIKPVPMRLIARVLPNQPFEPGPHPQYRVANPE